MPRASAKYNLSIINPALASQWHYEKNDPLTPSDVAPNSICKVWWRCMYGHEWQVQVRSRNTGTGCPYCFGLYPTDENNLATRNPELARQWHPTKNGDITPKDVLPNSGKKYWWICEKGHEWQAQCISRNRGHGCPHCYKINRRNYLDHVKKVNKLWVFPD